MWSVVMAWRTTPSTKASSSAGGIGVPGARRAPEAWAGGRTIASGWTGLAAAWASGFGLGWGLAGAGSEWADTRGVADDAAGFGLGVSAGETWAALFAPRPVLSAKTMKTLSIGRMDGTRAVSVRPS